MDSRWGYVRLLESYAMEARMTCDFCQHGYAPVTKVAGRDACKFCVEVDTNAYGACDGCKRPFRELDKGGIGLSNGMVVCTECHEG